MRKLFALGLVSLLLTISNSCKKDEEITESTSKVDFINELFSEPESVQIDGENYHLRAYVHRFFKPFGPANGGPLRAQVNIGLGFGPPQKHRFIIKRCYLLGMGELWFKNFSSDSTFNGFIIDNGPKWPPNEYVDVICEFELNNKLYRLRSRTQIERIN